MRDMIRGFLIMILLASMSLGAIANNKIMLKVGDSKIITLPNISKASIAEPNIADIINLSKSEIFVLAKNLGTTDLYIWSENKRYSYKVIVRNDSLQNKIKQSIGQNVDVIVAKNMIILKGVVKSDGEKKAAEEIAKVYSDKVTNLLRIAPRETSKNEYLTQEEEVEELINLKNVRVKIRGDKLILDGTVNNQNEHERALKIAKVYSKNIIDLLKVISPYQIMIEGKIIDLSETGSETLGIEWGTKAGKGTFSFSENRDGTEKASDNFKIGSMLRNANLDAQIKALIEDGKARVISSPTMMTLSGKQAELSVGGQVPVKSSISNQTTVTEGFEYKNYGLQIFITPEVIINGHINMNMRMMISDLNYGNTRDSNNNIVPEFYNRTADCNVDCINNQTIVISGLMRNQSNRSNEKIPILSKIPGLGRFFNNRINRNRKTELLIMLTPHLVRMEGNRVVEEVKIPEVNVQKRIVKVPKKTINKVVTKKVESNNNIIENAELNIKKSPIDRKKEIMKAFSSL
jgi:pilus assembly protein CpaC